MTPTSPLSSLSALDADLATVPGTVSVWCGPVGSADATYARAADATHYAASMMKVAVLSALYRADADQGLSLDAEVPVINDFASAKPGAPRFACDPAEDQDDDVWARLGTAASLRWLARHMIVRSSNLATNIVLTHVGLPAVQEVLRRAGTSRMRVERLIEDAAARVAGIDNVVTARDLAILMGSVATSEPMIEVLAAQEHRRDLAAGLPAGTRIAHKNGWVTGVRHSAGIVFPDDAPPYVVAVLTTTTLPDADACALLSTIARATWEQRHDIC